LADGEVQSLTRAHQSVALGAIAQEPDFGCGGFKDG
jgi:hypothetical protein